MPAPTAGPLAAEAFDGVYEGEIADGTAALPVRVLLRRRGDSVSGRYSWGLGEGAITGVVDGDTLAFAWRTHTDAGRGRLRASADGTRFEGTWGMGERPAGRGTWTATRTGR